MEHLKSNNVSGQIELEDTYCTIRISYVAEPDLDNNPIFYMTYLEFYTSGITLILSKWQQESVIKNFLPQILAECQKDLQRQIDHAEERYQLTKIDNEPKEN